jgi:lipid-A-disaccharide synthase-like uncharacterized protein
MSEALRELLYPLGFLSGLAFGARFLLQWLTSEMKQQSVVTPAFWRISLAGNLMLMIHSFIQVQYHVCLVQACNAVISWRNLNLMGEARDQAKLQTVVIWMCLALTVPTLAFVLNGESEWFRVPANAWNSTEKPIENIWHFIGFIGIVLFASRFWIQWWFAEKYKLSYLGRPFWWISLAGDLMSLVYFVRIVDLVNVIGPVVGLVPYLRNLMLINKEKNKNLQVLTD